MGFLSKLFGGGDGGASSAKAEPAPAQPSPAASNDALADDGPQLELTEAELDAAVQVPISEVEELPRPPSAKEEGAVAVSPEPPPVAPPAPAPASALGPETPRRPTGLDDSVVTSAPKLGDARVKAPPKAAPAPRPGAKAPPKSAPQSQKLPPATAAKAEAAKPEPALPQAFRTRRDHSRSPGFYSSVSPANGSFAVAAPGASSQLKKTVVGLAPPAGEAARAEPPAPASEVKPAPSVEKPESGAAALDAAAPSVAVAREEKEETSPGLGNTRSRHDPRALALPASDLELLVEFILDVAMGSASESWLEPTRAAVTRLGEAAAKAERLILHKSLQSLGQALAGSEPLDAARRSRVLESFAAVDLALPRPIDIAAQRATRERLIFEQLLAEIAASQPLLGQRLRDGGFVTLDRFTDAKADDLAAKIGSTPGQAEQIIGIFQGYREQRLRRGPALVKLGKQRALEARVSALSASSEEFQRACEGEDAKARREARRQRQADVSQLNLLLAELGESSILAELERCSVQGKIERVQRWLSERASA